MIRSAIIATGLALAGAMALAAPASALTMKECSTKYEAAKSSNTLNGMGWNDFRKAQCGTDATPAAAPAPAPVAPAPTTTVAKPKPMAPAVNSGNVVFPSSLSPKYSTQSAGKQRMHTCLDQYNANKANGGNGNLKWIQKGGGYYSQCNTRLKS